MAIGEEVEFREEMAIGEDRILDRLYASEEFLQTQADALDAKAGFLLVILTFLVDILTHLHFTYGMHICEIAATVVSGVLAIVALAIVGYRVEVPEDLSSNRDQVAAANDGCSKEEIKTVFLLGLMDESKRRIHVNKRLNLNKARLLIIAYFSMICAVATLIYGII